MENQEPVALSTVLPAVLQSIPNPSNSEDDREAYRASAAAHELWIRSGVPIRHSEKAKALANSQGPWTDLLHELEARLGEGFVMVLCGIRGTGKTQIATALIRSACKQEVSALYVKAIDVFMAIRKAFKKDEETEEEVVSRFCKPGLLVIDAMEVRGDTPFEDRLLNHIIDKRYDQMRDTLMITNETRAGFGDAVGPSIISRIHESGKVYETTWASFRERG